MDARRLAIDVSIRHAPSTEGNEPSHVLTCINGRETDSELIRLGGVLAALLSGRLTVLHAFTPGSTVSRERMTEDRKFARSLGAQLVELPAFSVSAGIVDFARTRGITHLLLEEPEEAERQHGNGATLRALDEIEIYLVATN